MGDGHGDSNRDGADVLPPDRRVERVDDGYLVLLPGASEVLHLTGDTAEAFETIHGGTGAMPERLAAAADRLADLGVVGRPGWTRRRMLRTGVTVAAAGVAVVALPTVAAAASPGTPPDTTAAPTTTTPVGSVDLVANPSFEDGSPYGQVPFWTIG